VIKQRDVYVYSERKPNNDCYYTGTYTVSSAMILARQVFEECPEREDLDSKVKDLLTDQIKETLYGLIKKRLSDISAALRVTYGSTQEVECASRLIQDLINDINYRRP
jgi:hypothetical protein